MTDTFRALCAELAEELHEHTCLYEGHESELVARARAALAEADGPAVPDGREPASVAMQPSDEELDDWHSRCADLTRLGEAEHYWAFDLQGDDVAAVARAALARWCHQPAQPVPVSERLPGPEDCDAESYCWRWNTIGRLWARQQYARRWYEFESHWLPAHALPTPETTND